MARPKLAEWVTAAGFVWARHRPGERCCKCGFPGGQILPLLRIPKKSRRNPGELIHLQDCLPAWQAQNRSDDQVSWTRQHLEGLQWKLEQARSARKASDQPGHDFANEPPTHWRKQNLDNDIAALEDRVARAERVLAEQEAKAP